MLETGIAEERDYRTNWDFSAKVLVICLSRVMRPEVCGWAKMPACSTVHRGGWRLMKVEDCRATFLIFKVQR